MKNLEIEKRAFLLLIENLDNDVYDLETKNNCISEIFINVLRHIGEDESVKILSNLKLSGTEELKNEVSSYLNAIDEGLLE
jgi:hypothetical protein